MLQQGGLLKATGMRGLGMPSGYQIVGACDATTGQATGSPSAYSLVQDPSGKLTCYGPTDPAFLQLMGLAVNSAAGPGFVSISPGPSLAPSTASATTPAANAATTATQPTNTDVMLGSLDATQFVSNYGIWLAVGAGAILLFAMAK